jgi:hypothetical protein
MHNPGRIFDSAPEAVDLVVLGPVHQVVYHQSLGHAMLGRYIVAACAVTHRAIFVAAVIVPWCNLVQNTVPVKTRREHVIVHDILHDAQAHIVQRLQRQAALKLRSEHTVSAQIHTSQRWTSSNACARACEAMSSSEHAVLLAAENGQHAAQACSM